MPRVVTWIVTSIVFRWYVSSIANFKTAVGQLTVFIVLMVYVYASSIVFLVGVELDEQLRADATSGERGVLSVLFGLDSYSAARIRAATAAASSGPPCFASGHSSTRNGSQNSRGVPG